MKEQIWRRGLMQPPEPRRDERRGWAKFIERRTQADGVQSM